MEKYLQEMTCPVCLEIPKKEIYQCRNGHIICSICVPPLSVCPQCRVVFEIKKIRSLALENILDKKVFDCKFKGEGCVAQMTRQEISEHNGTCEFGGFQIKFCQYIGIGNCDFMMSTSHLTDFMKHLQNHGSKGAPIVCANLATAFVIDHIDQPDMNQDCVWAQFITPQLPSKETYVILCFSTGEEQDVSFVCFKVNHDNNEALNEAEAGNIRAEFVIKAKNSKKPDIVYNTFPLDIKHTAMLDILPILPRYPLKVLGEHYAVNNQLKIGVSLVKIASTKIA